MKDQDAVELEILRSELISVLDDFLKHDNALLEVFRVNFNRFIEKIDPEDKLVITRIIKMEERLKRITRETKNLLLNAKSKEELSMIFWEFDNNLERKSSELDKITQEISSRTEKKLDKQHTHHN